MCWLKSRFNIIDHTSELLRLALQNVRTYITTSVGKLVRYKYSSIGKCENVQFVMQPWLDQLKVVDNNKLNCQ